MVKGIINAFDHNGILFGHKLIIGGNRAFTWPPIIATNMLPPFIPHSKYLLPTKIVNF